MIYYVEDDESIRELVLYTLRTAGFEAFGFESGEKFFDAVKKEKFPELILLDIMLPGEDGISVLRKAKKLFPEIPVIMVTAKGSEYDRVTGLDLGADDYVSKPFGMMELVSRIKAVLRRTGNKSGSGGKELLKCGAVELNIKSHTVTVSEKPIELTLKEFELLRTLMKNADAVITRDVLLESIWGYEEPGETRTVDVHIKTLRQKLGGGADIIKTVRGVGYKIVKS